jgi:hypothetical protein
MDTPTIRQIDLVDKSMIARIMADILLDQVDHKTVQYARRLPAVVQQHFDFVLVLTGAAEEVDYHELRELAREELARYLEGKDGNDGD